VASEIAEYRARTAGMDGSTMIPMDVPGDSSLTSQPAKIPSSTPDGSSPPTGIPKRWA
jgi:hypothetical protein